MVVPNDAEAAADSRKAKAKRIGTRLRALRKDAGLSAKKLVEKAFEISDGKFSLTEDAIYGFESGRVLMSRRHGKYLAQAMQVDPQNFFQGEETVAEILEEVTVVRKPPDPLLKTLEALREACLTPDDFKYFLQVAEGLGHPMKLTTFLELLCCRKSPSSE